jgi:hypothetical protein
MGPIDGGIRLPADGILLANTILLLPSASASFPRSEMNVLLAGIPLSNDTSLVGLAGFCLTAASCTPSGGPAPLLSAPSSDRRELLPTGAESGLSRSGLGLKLFVERRRTSCLGASFSQSLFRRSASNNGSTVSLTTSDSSSCNDTRSAK